MHAEVRETIDLLHSQQRLQGHDPFGFHPGMLEKVLPAAHAIYRHYFRVKPYGIDHVPDGRVLLIANHSGQLPFDAAMIATSLLIDRRPPRMVRSMVEKWVPTLPFVSTFMNRCGQVVGTPANARALLRQGEPLLVFPEGARGISKTIQQRYQLTEFGLGFMRLALETNTPVVPIAVVGAEEQIPAFYNARGVARVFGMPALPLSPTLLFPLPVKYRIFFGEPMVFEGDPDDEDRVVRARVQQVVAHIEAMIQRGLTERTSIFT